MKRMLRTGFGCLVLVAVFFFFGCSHLGKSANDTPSPERMYTEKEAPIASYLDFNDILIPHELKVVWKDTFILRTSGLTAGVLSLKGRVEQSSLISAFEGNMIKDNWRLVSFFKSPRALMLFQKDTRWCVINVYESNFVTNVEIWVSPTIDNSTSGLLR